MTMTDIIWSKLTRAGLSHLHLSPYTGWGEGPEGSHSPCPVGETLPSQVLCPAEGEHTV